ncbi:MAG: type I restriction enzyme endonuclease domain-containing protein, partial [bacterium]
RSDIIVIIDEAHRSQYKDLAENMRTGLPNAQYIAFTGTPLLGRDRLTYQWFGDYVSEYNFAQSIDDGATVPLFYDKRVPEVLIENDDLSDEFAEILEDENLTEDQQAKLERDFATEIEVIKRDDRLETIAKDIIYHFPRRGYKGKGMVIAVDKFTTVKMYDKVKYHRAEEMRRLRREINNCSDKKVQEELEKSLKFLRDMDMAVVISEDAGEEEKFKNQVLEIRSHRIRLNSTDENGHDLEYKFKDPGDPLQLVFICSMWLTGFDAPTVSTLYLDKPMKNHTLMQTIARANRVAPGKTNGLIVDYYNVFRNLKRALAEYAEGEEWKGEDTEAKDPVEEKSKLFKLLDASIAEGLEFCKNLDIDLQAILEANNVFENLSYFEQYADKLLQKDNWKKQFFVYDNTITALYDACKPDIFQKEFKRPLVSVINYLRGVLDRSNSVNVDRARKRISELLDESVVTTEESKVGDKVPQEYGIKKSRVFDLSRLNFDKLRASFHKAEYKHIEIADLHLFIEDKLKQMLEKNVTRIDFVTRFQELIDRYNAGGAMTENYFEDLMKFAEELREEEKRHIRMGLSEEELELFDLLEKDKMTKAEEQAIKLAAKRLLKRLKEEQPKVLTLSWFKDTQSTKIVRSAIMDVLDATLPDSYDRRIYNEKVNVVFDHIYTMASSGRGWAAAA